MLDDPPVPDLVARAAHGDQHAWNLLVERYARLVWSICRRHRLSNADIEDVSQTVWLRLVQQLDELRDARALPGWLATTTHRECIRVSLANSRQRAALDRSLGPDHSPDLVRQDIAAPDEMVADALLQDERALALRTGFAELSPECRRLLSVLLRDPPPSYKEISSQLEMPIGSIGPNRARCLEKLRRTTAVSALIKAETEGAKGGDERVPAVER
jgi:RNA polymerase sigma factor (sigma-70 family)